MVFEPTPAARARVRWLRESEGGRKAPPPGPEFWATAIFLGEGEGVYDTSDHYSIALRYPEGTGSTEEPRDTEIDFIARDLVKDKLVPGAKLRVMDGPHATAEAEVVEVLI